MRRFVTGTSRAEVIRCIRQLLPAPSAGAETTAACIAETGAWFATAPDVYAAEIGLFDTAPAGTRIGIREGTTSDIAGRCAQAPGAFRFSATVIVLSGGSIDPISSPAPVIAIRHLLPPRKSSASNGA